MVCLISAIGLLVGIKLGILLFVPQTPIYLSTMTLSYVQTGT